MISYFKFHDVSNVLLQTLNCKPIASLDHFGADMLASADMVEEVQCGASKVIKVSALFLRTSTESLMATNFNCIYYTCTLFYTLHVHCGTGT